jgi:hypothetical protein
MIPDGLHEHSVYVFHPTHRPADDARTGYLAVKAGGSPFLVPLPDLPRTLTHAEGTVTDTRFALRAFAVRIADLVNLALPAVRLLEPAASLEADIRQN